MDFREFLRECAEQLDAVAIRHPDFWAGLREELGRAQLTRGARNHRASHTAIPGTDRGIQVGPDTTDRVTQASGGELTPDRDPRSHSESRGRRRTPSPARPRGCWNCGGPHSYNACSLPIQAPFCFHCGRQDLTIKDCPKCKKAWRAEGPPRRKQAPSPEDRRRSGGSPRRGSSR